VIDAYRAAVASCDSAQIGRVAPGLSTVAKLRYKQLCERCPDPALQSTVKIDPSAIRLSGADAAEADLTIYLECRSTGDESLQRQTGVLARERGAIVDVLVEARLVDLGGGAAHRIDHRARGAADPERERRGEGPGADPPGGGGPGGKGGRCAGSRSHRVSSLRRAIA